MTTLKGRRRYKAITIIRKGRLSKNHLSDPKEGLPLEAKKAQEEPVEVILSPGEVMNIDDVRSGKEGADDGQDSSDESGDDSSE